MPNTKTSVDGLDFDRADFTAEIYEDNCRWCTRALTAACFTVRDKTAQEIRVCERCADRARQLSPPDTRAAFLRSILFGALTAAMVGMASFGLFRMTNISVMVFGSIGAGYLIGKAMRMGSNGVGGRRYQVMAAVLTYAAVTISTSAVILGTKDMPFGALPFLMFAPIVQFFTGRMELGGLEILFAALGIRWAWRLMAGAPWKITGPHPIEK
jgi:hypothetical protein